MANVATEDPSSLALNDQKSHLQITKSNYSLHTFTAEITERKVLFQVLSRPESTLIFINDKDDLQLTDLCFALLGRHDSKPLGTKLIGSQVEDESTLIACKLTKKLNKPVHLSCNFNFDATFFSLVQKRLFEEIKTHPDRF